jgi:hypothetical protein
MNTSDFKPLGPDLDHGSSRSNRKKEDKRKNFDDGGKPISEERKVEKNNFYTEPVDIKNDINSIESIDVTAFKEVIRDDKPTMVYVIEFFIKKQNFEAERSYNEFKSIYDEVTKIKSKESVFPALPPKTLK